MPPRRRSVPADSLTDDELTALAEAVAQGRRATVYLREATPSLGLPPGTSARVISVDGRTVLLRPRGVDDELPFEAEELRRSKNPPPPPEPKPRKRTQPSSTARKAAPAKTPAANTADATTPAAPAGAKPAAKGTAAPKPATTPAAPAPQQPAGEAPAPEQATPKAAAKTGARPAPRGGAKSVTVTIYGSPDNQWSVAVTRGARKPLRSRPVTPESVEASMRELRDVTATEAVTGLLLAARAEAQRRVDELAAELEAARQALAALEGRAD